MVAGPSVPTTGGSRRLVRGVETDVDGVEGCSVVVSSDVRVGVGRTVGVNDRVGSVVTVVVTGSAGAGSAVVMTGATAVDGMLVVVAERAGTEVDVCGGGGGGAGRGAGR